MKLYPTKSNSAKSTATNCGVKLPKAVFDALGLSDGKIIMLIHHKLADVVSGYLMARENVSAPYGTTGIYLTSGKLAYSFYWAGSISGACNIAVSALEDDNWYIITATIAGTISLKMNKVTRVNNAIVIGSDINSTTTAKGTTEATADMGLFAGCYSNGSLSAGSKHKIAYVKVLDDTNTCVLDIPLCNGAETLVTDVCNGVNYTVLNGTYPDFWANTQDFYHYNFRYGFTLYQKSGSPDLRIPNKEDGTEIIITPPSGYTRIGNYKECKKTFNQCESLFKLDDVSVGETTENKIVTGCNIAEVNGIYHLVGQNEGKDYWDNDTGYRIVWSAGYWYFAIAETFTVKYASNAENIWIAEPWQISDVGGGLPLPIPSIQTVVTPPDDLYTADVDHFLFTESTGIAKEIDIADVYSSVVDLTLDRGHLYINEDSDKNMMLYKTDKGVDTAADLKIWKYVNK